VKDKLKRLAEYITNSIDVAVKQLSNRIDDILFLLGVIFLSLSGFMIYTPIGYLTLGICCMAYAFIIAKSKSKADRGDV